MQGRLLSGVAAGVARHLGLEAWQVRLGFVALALAGGAGVVAYGLLWVLVRQDDAAQTAAETLRTAAARGRPDAQAQAVRTLEQVRRATHDSEPVRLLLGGLALCVVAAFLVAGRLGISLPWPWLLPVLVVIAGAVLALSQLDTSERTRWLEPVGIRGTGGLVRLLGGLLLVTAGAVMLLEPDLDVQQVTLVVIAALAVLVGIALVLGPWALRLWRDLEKERGLREREQERAEIAAHLHDSVLHTLSLIQRRPGDADEVVAARPRAGAAAARVALQLRAAGAGRGRDRVGRRPPRLRRGRGRRGRRGRGRGRRRRAARPAHRGPGQGDA